MPSRKWIEHTVSSSPPTSGRLGDEHFNPDSNTLTKRVAINGSTVTDAQIPIVSDGNIKLDSSTGVATIATTTSSIPLALGTGGNEWVRIKTDGSIGIGTNSPTFQVDVWSNIPTNAPFIALRNQSGASSGTFGPGITFDNGLPGANPFILQMYQGNIGSTGNVLAISNAASPYTPYFSIDQNGNVGINGTTVTTGNKLQVNGAIADSAGNVRDIVNNGQGGAYVLALSDNGKLINITTGGVTVNTGIFSAGNNITIFNNSAASQTITQGVGVTMYLAGTATTGNRTLSQRGICTIVCVAANTFVISGSGLS